MREYALVFLVAAAVTYLLTPIARRFAVATQTLARPRDRDVHAIPTPYLGGLAMLGGAVAAMFVARALPSLQNVRGTPEPKAVLVAGTLICAVGIIDDKWQLDAFTKLAGQAVAAGLLVLLGVQLQFVTLPGTGAQNFALDPNTAVVATVVLTLVMVNSINFIDGLDGLAAGVVGIAAVAFFGFCYQLSAVQHITRVTPATLLAAIVAGICVGFLPHNFSPARIFMGDSGSMLLGLLLAAAVTSGTTSFDPTAFSAGRGATFFFPVLLPLTVLAVPFVDLVLAVLRRTRTGRSVFAPDKEHLHHRLLEIGHTHRRAVLTIWYWAAVLAFGGVAAAFVPLPLVLTGVGVATLVGAAVSLVRPGGGADTGPDADVVSLDDVRRSAG
ncbi:MAG TPA: MraY family glycosyltransferase [Mycobacteriales bacterium]|jgi:UDP-GlcNAc:undecaprenyl-phosphate GlcNAc-1-phosphate transferase|nr:MraY family glycosyltransferase [Mycobacteriales bacterium]